MKVHNYLYILAFLLIIVAGCQKGIDPITKVEPGPDTAAPVILINYPVEGTLIRVPDKIAPIKIQVEASDDIELKSIVINLDGTDIASFSTFIDYRRAVESFIYDKLANGTHILLVTATDLSGKTTTASVNFKKTDPYVPEISGEVFYMPIDGDYVELITNNEATKYGLPTFVDGKKGKAYAGATDAYLTYPFTGLGGTEFSVAFWYKLIAPPDRGGILSISRPNSGTLTTAPPDSTRWKGFRMFHENSGTNQNIGVNLGTGKAEVWISPIITITPPGTWMHIAVSVSTSVATVYINGAVAKTAPLDGPIDWTSCTLISIASGVPNFVYWSHLYDLSQYDEIHIFNKAISAADVTKLYTVK